MGEEAGGEGPGGEGPGRDAGGGSLAEEAVGALGATGAAVLFGGVVVLGTLAGRRGLPVAPMLAFRFGVAAVLLALLLAALRRPLRPAPGEGVGLVALGGVGYAAEAGLFFFALRHGTAAAVSLLFFTYPVWVTVISALAGRGAPGGLVAGSLVAAVAGAALVVASSGGLDVTTLGIVLALAASVTYAAYLVAVDALFERSGTLAAALWVSVGASLGLGAFALLTGSATAPSGGTEWLLVAGMGLFTSGAFFGLLLGLRRLGAVRASIVAAMEPVATAALAVAFLDEPLRAVTAVGGVLIVGAAVAASVARPGPPAEGVP